MKPNHKCDPARMALLYIRQQFICTTFKFDAYIHYELMISTFQLLNVLLNATSSLILLSLRCLITASMASGAVLTVFET